MPLKVFFLSFILSISLKGFSQTHIFIKKYEWMKNSYTTAITEHPDGSYLIAGYTKENNSQVTETFILKTNASGDSLWSKIIAGSNAYPSAIQVTPNGDILLAGTVYHPGPKKSAWIYYIDATGKLLKARYIGGGNIEMYFNDIKPTTDGGWIAVGFGVDASNQSHNAVVYKLSDNLDTQWIKYIGGIYRDEFKSVAALSNGNFLASGSTKSYSPNSSRNDLFISNFNHSGQSVTNHNFGHPTYDDWANDMAIAPDGSIVITGVRNSITSTTGNLYFLKLKPNGSPFLETTINFNNQNNEPIAITASADGNFFITGRSYKPNNQRNAFIIKINTDGELIWEYIFDDDNNNTEHSQSSEGVIVSKTGDIVIAGNYQRGSFPVQNDIFILKISDNNLSVNPSENIEQVSVYPNPASLGGFLNLKLNTSGSLKYSIINYQGQALVNGNLFSSGTSQIDISGLKKGFYFLHFEFNGKVKTAKFTIQ